jgi:hypothetical protein
VTYLSARHDPTCQSVGAADAHRRARNTLTGPNPGCTHLPFETFAAMSGGLQAAAVETADVFPVFFLAGRLFGGLLS